MARVTQQRVLGEEAHSCICCPWLHAVPPQIVTCTVATLVADL